MESKDIKKIVFQSEVQVIELLINKKGTKKIKAR